MFYLGAVTKPEFGDLDDELRELLEAEAAGGGGFAAAARRVAAAPPPGAGGDSSSSDEEADEEADAAEAEEGGEDGEGGSRFSKRAMKKWRKCDPRVPMLLCFDLDSDTFPSFCVCRQLESKLQEYYSLDCEDFVAGLPCRFRYKQVLPNKYGLKTEEILALTDKELNQVVSLKKLAPYREEDAKPKCALLLRLLMHASRLANDTWRAQVWRQARARGGGAGAPGGVGARSSRREGACLDDAAAILCSRADFWIGIAFQRKKKRGDGDADDEAAAAAARARSFVAPTKKARREAAEAARAGPGAGAGGSKLSKNAAKHAKRKAKKEAAGGGDDE